MRAIVRAVPDLGFPALGAWLSLSAAPPPLAVERIHKAVKEAMGMVLNGPASSAGSGAASSAAPSVDKTMLKELFVERHRRAHRPVGILNVLLPCPVSPSNILEELVDPPRASMLGPVRAQALTQGRNWHIHVLKVD